jgi:hypothetical protein
MNGGASKIATNLPATQGAKAAATTKSRGRPDNGQRDKSACVRMILPLRQLTSGDGNNRICRHEQNAIRRLVEIGLGTAGLKRKGTK